MLISGIQLFCDTPSVHSRFDVALLDVAAAIQALVEGMRQE
jgi:hypothetical protein